MDGLNILSLNQYGGKRMFIEMDGDIFNVKCISFISDIKNKYSTYSFSILLNGYSKEIIIYAKDRLEAEAKRRHFLDGIHRINDKEY